MLTTRQKTLSAAFMCFLSVCRCRFFKTVIKKRYWKMLKARDKMNMFYWSWKIQKVSDKLNICFIGSFDRSVCLVTSVILAGNPCSAKQRSKLSGSDVDCVVVTLIMCQWYTAFMTYLVNVFVYFDDAELFSAMRTFPIWFILLETSPCIYCWYLSPWFIWSKW